MRDLILLRHAESIRLAVDGEDRERPLSLRGEEEARAAGVWLAAHGARPDAVLCSPALRARMTAERALDALGAPALASRFLPGIYGGTPGELIALLEGDATTQHAQRVLLVGHNPGLEQLLALLVSGRSGEARGLPPAAVAWIELDGGFEPGRGTLRAFWSP